MTLFKPLVTAMLVLFLVSSAQLHAKPSEGWQGWSDDLFEYAERPELALPRRQARACEKGALVNRAGSWPRPEGRQIWR